ncbi:MAG: S-ribosylhomocysteine lyase [Clostridia bacterium]|nr:S-ribosylhomocysteine lyase [Clostridia bacterium]
MEKIESFKVDHCRLEPGIYVSRRDGDIVTYDLRMRKPNTGELMSNSQMHSLEHMLATYLRNGPIGDKVIYVGPMGCQTGFYVLVKMDDNERFLAALKEALRKITGHEGEIFGKSPRECGNYINLDCEAAKAEAQGFLDVLNNGNNTFLYN